MKSYQPLLVLAALAALAPVSACQAQPKATPGEYLFCFWNVENFFDDEDDKRDDADKLYDEWFARDKAALEKKLHNISRVLLGLNDGRGPDIIALAGCEAKERAVQLLLEALNKGLKDKALHYNALAIMDPKGGRDIATAVLTRLKIVGDKTRLLGRRQRILEMHIDAGGQELVVVASYWTSRVSDKTGDGRDKYADAIYGQFKGAFKSDPSAAWLVCGTFNDNPTDDSVKDNLHAIGDRAKVLKSNRDEPYLFNLMAGFKIGPESFTYAYSGRHYIYDQIAVSPGMLGAVGWQVLPETATLVANEWTTEKRPRAGVIPWRFGGPRDTVERGVSDHLPVTVKLRVGGK